MQFLKKDIRQRIINAAAQEFRQFGYANASIRNIAHTAEISLGNIYRYFSNKEALYLAILNPLSQICSAFISTQFDFDNVVSTSKKIVEFEVANDDHLSIVKQGSSEHFQLFLVELKTSLANKITEYLISKGKTQVAQQLVSSISSSYLYGLFPLFDGEIEDIYFKVEQFTVFYFQLLTERIS